MRKVMVTASLLLVSGAAFADGAIKHPAASRGPAPLEGNVPMECRGWVQAESHAANAQMRSGAQLSLASCLATMRFEALSLTADDASLQALAAAARPALAILDDLMRGDDAAYQIIAAQSKGDLLDAMVVRMRNTGAGALEPQLAAWLADGDAAFREALRVAKLHPELATTNPVVASAVHSSEAHLAAAPPPAGKK
jgi:hypothetical protein